MSLSEFLSVYCNDNVKRWCLSYFRKTINWFWITSEGIILLSNKMSFSNIKIVSLWLTFWILDYWDNFSIFNNYFNNLKFWFWNHTTICELSTENCFYTSEMEITKCNRRWILNKESVNILYFILLVSLTKEMFSIHNIS